MINIRPHRAWAAAATVAAIAIAGFASVATASVQTLVGVDRVPFAWQPATGDPGYYFVSRSLNGGPLQTYAITSANSIAIPVAPGDQIQISVKAAGYDSAGVYQIGPSSPVSDTVVVLPAPQFQGTDSLLLHCATCPSIARRPIADASVLAAQSTGLPSPWAVLGRAELVRNADAIVWHNRDTGELALWDSESLAPIPGAVGITSTAIRRVGGADLDRDGIEEFIVQRTDTLVVHVFSLTSTGFRLVGRLHGPPGAKLVAGRDLDRDGRVEFLWQDPLTGSLDLARLVVDPVFGATPTSLLTLEPTPLMTGLPSDASVASTGDYDGDGYVDLLLRFSNGGLLVVYLERGQLDRFVWLPEADGDGQRYVIGSTDVDGVGGDEIALRHRPTGEISILYPAIRSRAVRVVVLNAGSAWRAFGISP